MIKISDEIPKYSITRNIHTPSKTKSIFTCNLCKAHSVSHANMDENEEKKPLLSGEEGRDNYTKDNDTDKVQT